MSISQKKYNRLKAYNDIITKNKKSFKAGVTVSRANFITMFGLKGIVDTGNYKDVHKSNLKLVKAQTEINKLMNQSGLHVKSSDYYSEFTISNKERTKNEITRYSAKVERNLMATSTLENQMNLRLQRKNWGTYNRLKATTIRNLDNTPTSPRHQAVLNRVKHFT
jgi:hypothetical protein